MTDASGDPDPDSEQPPLHVRSVHYDHRTSETVAIAEVSNSILKAKGSVVMRLWERSPSDGLQLVQEQETNFVSPKAIHWTNRKFNYSHAAGLVKGRLGDLSQMQHPLVSLIHDGREYFTDEMMVSTQIESIEGQSKSAVCIGPLFGTPPTLMEWVTYQFEKLGADRIFLYSSGDGIESGFLKHWLANHPRITLIHWPAVYTADQIFYQSGHLVPLDCMYRAMPTHTHAAYLDSDDFVVGSNFSTLAASPDCKPCCMLGWRTRFIDSGLNPPTKEVPWWDIPGRIKCKDEHTHTTWKSFYTLSDMKEFGRHYGYRPWCKHYSDDSTYAAHARSIKSEPVGRYKASIAGNRLPEACRPENFE